jgi:hypothetical protein
MFFLHLIHSLILFSLVLSVSAIFAYRLDPLPESLAVVGLVRDRAGNFRALVSGERIVFDRYDFPAALVARVLLLLLVVLDEDLLFASPAEIEPGKLGVLAMSSSSVSIALSKPPVPVLVPVDLE